MRAALVYNADTRHGFDHESSVVGEFGSGSLQGVRHTDLICENIRNKLIFFSGLPIDVFVSIDEHHILPPEIEDELEEMRWKGEIKQWEYSPKDRTQHRWWDHIYLNALRRVPLQEYDYVIHNDQDNSMFRDSDSNIVHQYLKWLDSYSYVCQQSSDGDPMYHASTRFFITKASTLDLDEAERCFNEDYKQAKYGMTHTPCLEHCLGLIAPNGVLYPDPNPSEYLVINWSSYHAGLLKKLHGMAYEDIRSYIEDCGIFGAADVIAKPL